MRCAELSCRENRVGSSQSYSDDLNHPWIHRASTVAWGVLQLVALLVALAIPALRPASAQGLAPPVPPADKSDEVKRWLERVAGVRTTNPHQRDHASVRTAFAEVVQQCRLSTVRVLGDDVQIALGAVVDADGLIVTKASELKGKITCAFADGRKFPAELVETSDEYDLALLKIAARDLSPVRWAEEEPFVGSWLATPNHDRIPAAIGVMSNSPRAIPAPLGFLGVGLDNERPLVIHVYPGMAADKAGLKVSDLVLQAGGVAVRTREELQAQVRRRQPGQTLQLLVKRGQSQFELPVVLGDAPTAATNERIEFQNRLGGQLSQRRAGFPLALQHDTVLRPNECGGPLVDLDGQVVALNIARAGRVASFAVPASVVVPLIASWKSGKLEAGAVVQGSARTGNAEVTMPTSVTRPE
jgi:serine protease Do